MRTLGQPTCTCVGGLYGMFEWPSLTEQDALLHLGAKPELRVHTQEARIAPAEQRPQPPGDPFPMAPPHSQQSEKCCDTAQRDTEWPDVSLAEQARRLVRAIVVRDVPTDRAEQAVRPLWENGAGRSKVRPSSGLAAAKVTSCMSAA